MSIGTEEVGELHELLGRVVNMVREGSHFLHMVLCPAATRHDGHPRSRAAASSAAAADAMSNCCSFGGPLPPPPSPPSAGRRWVSAAATALA